MWFGLFIDWHVSIIMGEIIINYHWFIQSVIQRMGSLVVKIPVSHTGDREFKSLSIH